MMLAYRLVRLIEVHAAALADSLLERVQSSPHTLAYRNVPEEELRQRVYEIYEHLGEWLLSKSDAEIERRYTRIGARRAQQQVPLSQLAWALVLTRDNLWVFLKRELVMDRPVDIFGELEFVQLLEQFFDRAIYYAALGYESEAAARAKPPKLAKAG
jgi:hypothetical protein